MDQLPRVVAVVAAPFLAFIVGACSLLPAATLGPSGLALQQLAANQTLWASTNIDDYVMTIEERCFCPSAQYEVTVADGVVTDVTKAGAPVKPAEVQRLPKIVPELFARIAGLPPGAEFSVSYDATFGFPNLINVDPIPNAVDDEYAIAVLAFTPAS